MLFQHLFMYGKFFSPDGDGGGGSAANADGGEGDEGDDSGNQSGGDSRDDAADDRAELKAALAKERKAARDASQALKAAQKKIDDAAEAKAREDGDYKALLEARDKDLKARDKELAELKAERDSERLTGLREKYGAKERIPEDLWKKIEGDDEDAIKADAKSLAKHLGGREAPEDDAGERSRTNGKKTKKDEAYKDPSHWL